MTVCEIRVPTYRRPKLLGRALKSVCEQSHADWRCIVFDDCPEGSARDIVEQFADTRFSYVQNRPAQGAIGNIDQSFRNRPFAGGEWAMVLEDDNYIMSDHLASQLENCVAQDVRVLLSAQLVEEIAEPGEPGALLDKKTLAWIYPEGRAASRSLLPAVLFSHAFSNGAAFWKIGGATDFEIGARTRRPGVQETLRILRLKDDVYVSHRATAVWRSNNPIDSYVSQAVSVGLSTRLKARWRQLCELREINDYRRWYLSRFGLEDACAFATHLGSEHKPRIERAILLSGYYVAMTGHSASWRLALLAKGHAFRAVICKHLSMDGFEAGVADGRSATAG